MMIAIEVAMTVMIAMVVTMTTVMPIQVLQLSPAYPGGAKGARTPSGSKAKTVKSACFGLILI